MVGFEMFWEGASSDNGDLIGMFFSLVVPGFGGRKDGRDVEDIERQWGQKRTGWKTG